MADQESKIKELIQLLIAYYDSLNYWKKYSNNYDNVQQSLKNLNDFYETNAAIKDTKFDLWKIIEDTKKNQVEFVYNKFKQLEQQKQLEQSNAGGKARSKRRHASKGKGKNRRHKRTQRRTRVRRGGNRFHGSNATPPVVCSAGNSKIPCTAFSTA